MSHDYPMAGRGVYVEDFVINGQRGFYSVNSLGELVGYRTVRHKKDPSGAIAELWDELNEADPISPHDVSPLLRLVT